MTKVIITGIVAEEPNRTKLPSGRDKVSVVVVEQTMTYGKKFRENRFQVVFTGKRMKQVNDPDIGRGDTVAIVGQLNGIERRGKFLHYIYGQQLIVVNKIKREEKGAEHE